MMKFKIICLVCNTEATFTGFEWEPDRKIRIDSYGNHCDGTGNGVSISCECGNELETTDPDKDY